MLRDLLRAEGVSIGPEHVRTLMRRIGISAVYQRPKTTQRHRAHLVFPYLLRTLWGEPASEKQINVDLPKQPEETETSQRWTPARQRQWLSSVPIMDKIQGLISTMAAELNRLGLNIADAPFGAGSIAGERLEAFVGRLQTLKPGVTWHDVLSGNATSGERPDVIHADSSYRPLGPFDYPSRPAAPAFYVLWKEPGAQDRHTDLIRAAIKFGWPVYGGGITPERRPGNVDDLGFVVLTRGTQEEVTDSMCEWLLNQPGVAHARLYRRDNED